MSLDRHAAERRRFARLLGTDGEHGCGLPIGSHSSRTTNGTDADDNDHDRETAADRSTASR